MIELKNFFNADLFVSASQLKKADDDYNVIVCGFGSTSCEKEESTNFLIKNKKARLFWLVGEYEQSTFAPLFYSKRKFSVIKNYKHLMKNKMVEDQYFININSLISGDYKENNSAKHGGIYYGRWRNDRAVYFKKYLQSGVFLSSSPKNHKIFSGNGCNPEYLKSLSWTDKKEQLKLFSSSLYIEDVFTHNHYNCPANRYYEAVKYGVPLLFDKNSLNTFDEYEIAIPNSLIVNNHNEFLQATKDIKNNNDAISFLKVAGKKAVDDKSICLNSLKEIFSQQSLGKPNGSNT
jgi:hypothetical protein